MPFALITFFGALLLFVVQPMLAKELLPRVGGSPAVWAACMVLYQLLLLAGYVYADLISTRLRPAAQVRLHVVVIVIASLALFLLPAGGPPTLPAVTPALAIPWVLTREVGLPFFVLASTAPLFQRWSALLTARSPYALYAWSNAGSLVGLLAYPLLLEPELALERQRPLWATAFWLFALGSTWAAMSVARARVPAPKPVPDAPAEPSTRATRARWLALAFVPSVLLLGATNHITVDVAAMPLLWVVPLVLYLSSFILAFSVWRPAWRGPLLALWILAAVGLGVNAYAQAAAPLWRQLGAALLGLFAAAMLCHGELARERPAVGELTRYYVLIASGGALGGVFVSLVAPNLFSDYYELELGALAAFVVLLVAARRSAAEPWERWERLGLFLGAGVCVPLLASNLLVRSQTTTLQGRVVERSRSFLGPLKVVDLPAGRMLTHGRIQHGFQLSEPALRRNPTLYFGPETLLGRVLASYHADRARRIGVVGLGAGTIASYGRPGDELRFYELDDQVVDLARRDFSFLRDSAAGVGVVVGDGRLELAREPSHGFDVLVLDAFTSDAVPVHLLTREAFAIYARQLGGDGVLLANVSNRYLSVERVVCGSARSVGMGCAVAESAADPKRHLVRAKWALMAREARTLDELTRGLALEPAPAEVAWSDTHASILPILRWRRR